MEINFPTPSMSTIEVAKNLLGMVLKVKINDEVMCGYIVETEAYLFPEDECSHSYQGKRTPKNEVMYDKAGTWYVYQIHTYNMLNLVTREKNVSEAVLIRGIEPIFPKTKEILTNGPGKLTRFYGITRELNGTTIQNGFLTLEKGKIPQKILSTARIGVSGSEKWKEAPLRFCVAGNPYVSKMKKRETERAEDTWN
ncbi:DNA-3-methyladenine glycosylase [Pilibacter termitis]|uniref:Putative 3-methyladenine DNA glycosylase n=1 Tax=Pilibacter termitis TaxID=263852 RepID=A0A1T4RJ11_9ENTE|nr:DNA-3-methyladenine glycosylase [Pilibacter termitis]SKA15909.1 DNA-3-methyladenine glycosylase [Pilibacter termitis]